MGQVSISMCYIQQMQVSVFLHRLEKLSFVFHWKMKDIFPLKNERHLMRGEKKEKNHTSKQTKLNKQQKKVAQISCRMLTLPANFWSTLLCNSGGTLHLLAESSAGSPLHRRKCQEKRTKPWQSHVFYRKLLISCLTDLAKNFFQLRQCMLLFPLDFRSGFIYLRYK